MTRPRPSRLDLPAVLANLEACRRAMVALAASCRPRSLMRASADQMVRNIDELAMMLTGDRTHFHDKGHGPSRTPDPGEP